MTTGFPVFSEVHDALVHLVAGRDPPAGRVDLQHHGLDGRVFPGLTQGVRETLRCHGRLYPAKAAVCRGDGALDGYRDYLVRPPAGDVLLLVDVRCGAGRAPGRADGDDHHDREHSEAKKANDHEPPDHPGPPAASPPATVGRPLWLPTGVPTRVPTGFPLRVVLRVQSRPLLLRRSHCGAAALTVTKTPKPTTTTTRIIRKASPTHDIAHEPADSP